MPTIQEDLDTLQAGISKLILLANVPETKETKAVNDKFMMDELQPLIAAGFRVVGSLFVNLDKIAFFSEERYHRDGQR